MKKLFISADLEGVSGVSSWEETRYGRPGYDAACRQLTREVAAACRAAQELGYTVLVKDGHEDARNIDPTGLPRGVLLHRGWQNEPAAMMCGLDASYDAALYIGYHAPEGSDGSPLAHTIEHPLYAWMKLDGVLASEFSMNALWLPPWAYRLCFFPVTASSASLPKHAARASGRTQPKTVSAAPSGVSIRMRQWKESTPAFSKRSRSPISRYL